MSLASGPNGVSSERTGRAGGGGFAIATSTFASETANRRRSLKRRDQDRGGIHHSGPCKVDEPAGPHVETETRVAGKAHGERPAVETRVVDDARHGGCERLSEDRARGALLQRPAGGQRPGGMHVRGAAARQNAFPLGGADGVRRARGARLPLRNPGIRGAADAHQRRSAGQGGQAPAQELAAIGRAAAPRLLGADFGDARLDRGSLPLSADDLGRVPRENDPVGASQVAGTAESVRRANQTGARQGGRILKNLAAAVAEQRRLAGDDPKIVPDLVGRERLQRLARNGAGHDQKRAARAHRGFQRLEERFMELELAFGQKNERGLVAAFGRDRIRHEIRRDVAAFPPEPVPPQQGRLDRPPRFDGDESVVADRFERVSDHVAQCGVAAGGHRRDASEVLASRGRRRPRAKFRDHRVRVRRDGALQRRRVDPRRNRPKRADRDSAGENDGGRGAVSKVLAHAPGCAPKQPKAGPLEAPGRIQRVRDRRAGADDARPGSVPPFDQHGSTAGAERHRNRVRQQVDAAQHGAACVFPRSNRGAGRRNQALPFGSGRRLRPK